jgi:hypothetical protein
MPNQDYTRDPAFVKAKPEDQHAFLMSVDPEYAKAAPADQAKYRNQILEPSRRATISTSGQQFIKEHQGGGVVNALKSMIPSIEDPTEGRSPLDPKFWLNTDKSKFDPTGSGTAISELTRPLPKDLPGVTGRGGSTLGRGIYRGAAALSPVMDARTAEAASAKGDTSGVATQAIAPLATMALGEGLKTGAAGRALTAAKPGLTAIADAVQHPTEIPGRIAKAAISRIPEKPTYPGAPLPAADEFYKNRGEEINTIRERTEANKPGPELGSPENPGWHSKLPTTMPKKIEPPSPPPELGSPENPGWHSKIPNTMPKAALPNIAPEQAGPPAQLPAGGSTQKLPTKFQKEVKPQILNFNDLANKVFNVKELDPKTPLNQQLENQPPKPLEVTDPMKAKYPDPGVRQMVRANGERMYEAAKHDPMLVKQIHDLTRVDLRQAVINAGEDMGQTTVSNSKFAGEGSIPREEAFNRLLDKGLTPEKIIELAKKTEGTANDRPQVKYKGGINEKGVEASTRQMSDKESISELENQIDTMSKTLKTSSRSAEEKAQLKQQISEYQARLDELRGTAKK